MNTYYFEMTDLFGGELNYCWLRRYIVNASNLTQAKRKLSKELGIKKSRFNGLYNKIQGACVAFYELDYEVCNDWIEKAEKIE